MSPSAANSNKINEIIEFLVNYTIGDAICSQPM